MAGRIEILWHLFVASAKMFLRDRTAVFFSFFLPLVIMLHLRGPELREAAAELDLGIVDEADTASSAGGHRRLRGGAGPDDQCGYARRGAGRPGGRRSVPGARVPRGLGAGAPGRERVPAAHGLHERGQSRPRAQTALLIVNAVVAQAIVTAGGGSARPLVVVEEVAGRDLAYIDFLVPGILGLTIMQLGLFSVAFGFVQLKQTGTLRRLFATPTSPSYFLSAQVSSRLIIALVQVLILLGVGLWFGVQLVGSVIVVLALSVLGSIVFLAMGYGVAGWAKNENQAAPVANLISLPMMFLSGSFFPREAMPEFLQQVTRSCP